MSMRYRFNLTNTSISITDSLRLNGSIISRSELAKLNIASVNLSAKIRNSTPNEVNMSIIVKMKTKSWQHQQYYRYFKLSALDAAVNIPNITSKNKYVAGILSIKSDIYKQLYNLAYIIINVKQYEHIQPVNGDMLAFSYVSGVSSHDYGNVGLYYENLLFPRMNYLDREYCLPKKYTVIPQHIVETYFSSTKENIQKTMQNRLPLIYDYNLARKMQETGLFKNDDTPHEPGHVYILCNSLYRIEMYLGYGTLFNTQTMTSKNGHVYINVSLGKWSNDLLAYGRPNINIDDLKTIIYNTLHDEEGNIRLLTKKSFSNICVLKNRRKSFRYDFGHVINKEGNFTIADAQDEVCYMFMPKSIDTN